MIYKRIEPPAHLTALIDSFWIAEDSAGVPVKQKIIPDGFPEIIFHYKDSYRIKLGNSWQIQSKRLLAGQITKYFYLENSGVSGVFGIKMKPAAVHGIFGINMSELTDQVVDLDRISRQDAAAIAGIIDGSKSHESIAVEVGAYIHRLASEQHFDTEKTEAALDMIFREKGKPGVEKLSEAAGVSRRQLERLFKRQIGLTPKQYLRVIRFSHIFKLMEEKDASWVNLAFEGGYYDQSHFIKDFREFSGENPSDYMFGEENMANFFMNRPG